MGGTSLVTKGILGPIEGDIIFRQIGLPLDIDAVETDMVIELPEEILTEVALPDEVSAEIVVTGLGMDVEVARLEVIVKVEE